MDNYGMENLYSKRSAAKTKLILGIIFTAVSLFFFIIEIASILFEMALIGVILFLLGLPLFGIGIPFIIIGIIGFTKANRQIALNEMGSNTYYDNTYSQSYAQPEGQ